MAFRIIFFLVLVLTFSISAYFRKKARESEVIARREEGIVVLVLRMALALPLLASLLLYVFYPRWLAWSQVSLPLWLRILFAAIAILCVPMIWWVFRGIGKNISETVLTKTNHELVTTGPYRWVRHPLYASTLTLLCSFSIIASNWFIFAYWLIALIVFRYLVIPAEEKRLVDVFGDEYENYQLRTGALMPRFFR